MDREENSISRREFLSAAAVGAAVMAAGPVFKVSAKEEPKMAGMADIYVCTVCGHVEFGSAPETCPVCHSPKDKFAEKNSLFTDAQKKWPDAGASHYPVITVKKDPSFLSDVPCKEVSVRVGKHMHPMEEAHHIRFIDLYVDDKFITRAFPNLKQLPAVSYYLNTPGSKVRAIEFCTVHDYWQAETVFA